MKPIDKFTHQMVDMALGQKEGGLQKRLDAILYQHASLTGGDSFPIAAIGQRVYFHSNYPGSRHTPEHIAQFKNRFIHSSLAGQLAEIDLEFQALERQWRTPLNSMFRLAYHKAEGDPDDLAFLLYDFAGELLNNLPDFRYGEHLPALKPTDKALFDARCHRTISLISLLKMDALLAGQPWP